MSEGTVLTAADIEELAKGLSPLSDETTVKLRELLCPVAPSDLGLEGVLKYWVEHESNPTREKLLELTRKLEIELPVEGSQKSEASGTSLVSTVVGILSGPLQYLSKRKDVKDLIEACGKGRRRVVFDLLNKDIKPNQAQGTKTPLVAASLMGHLDIVNDLLRAKADVQFTGAGRGAQTALMAASSRGHYEIAELLLDSGASVNAMDDEKWTALHAAAFEGHSKVANLLIKRGANINKQSDDGSTPLMVASSGGHFKTVRFLLSSGANTSIRLPEWGRTALHFASSRCHAKVVNLLLTAAGYEINDPDKLGLTPLMLATLAYPLAGRLETVEFLANAGADLNAQSNKGETALMFAAMEKRFDEAKILIKAGADVNIQDENGWSAIFFAAKKADMPMSQLLCESGANLDLVSKKKKSVLDIAKRVTPIHKMLLEAKKEIRSPDQKVTQAEPGHEYGSESLPELESGGNRDTIVPQMPAYYKYDDQYPGIRFFGSPWTISVTSEGAHINWEKEIGIGFDIPPSAVPVGRQLDLSVWPCAGGPFLLPEGCEMASPVFLVSPSFEFSCDITMTMHHFCAMETEGNCESMVFLSSPTAPSVGECRDSEYRFRVLNKGTFHPREDYGRVSLKHFCLSMIGALLRGDKPKKRYAFQVYRKTPCTDMSIFSASLHDPLHFRALRSYVQQYFPQTLYPLSIVPINICEDKLELNWPTDNGWEIIPDSRPCEISREMLDSPHATGFYPPVIQLDVKKDTTALSGRSTHIEIDIVGTSEENKFTLIPTLSEEQGTSAPATTSSSHTDTVLVRTGKLGEAEGKPDINRDVLKAKRLLKSLDKDELKDLFRELGLSDTSVRDKYSERVSVYADDLVRSWILERDAVLESEVYLGGATWENLKKALIELKHIGIASKIVLR